MVFWNQNAICFGFFLTFAKVPRRSYDLPAAELTGLGELDHHQRSLRRLRRGFWGGKGWAAGGWQMSWVSGAVKSLEKRRSSNEVLTGEKPEGFSLVGWKADRNGGLATILKASDLGQQYCWALSKHLALPNALDPLVELSALGFEQLAFFGYEYSRFLDFGWFW